MGTLNLSYALWSMTMAPDQNSLDEALEKVAAIGPKAIQPWCVDVEKWGITTILDPDRCVGRQRAELAQHIRRDFGLEISGFCAQLTGPDVFGNFAGVDRLDERIRKTQASLELAADMRSPIVTTHIGPVPHGRESEEYQHYARAVRKVADAAEKTEAYFAMEVGQEPMEVLLWLIEDVGSPNVKINFDPANAMPYGTPESVRAVGEHIVHSHAKDRPVDPETGELGDHDVPVGAGGVPWSEFFAAMREVGYEGWYAIEDESGSGAEESLRESFAFLSQF